MLVKPLLRHSALVLLLFALSLGVASNALSKNKPAYYTANGLALEGYDAVAYFKDKRAIIGNDDYSTRWDGVEWRFATADNRDQFLSKPSFYAPQFGGYCAYGISQGYAVRGAPKQWTVYRNKLYLNYSAGVRTQWLQAKDNYIELARRNVSSILAN